MYYNDFHGCKLSALGLGAMRLPLLPGGTNADIDQEQLEQMVALALRSGINYFDTAWAYHGSISEIALGKVLSAYPRDSFYLADKYPGHQTAKSYYPEEIFEQQLKKCGVDYFDFYLMHNVNENSIGTYLNPKWGIHDYFKKQKELGRIRHFGFSCHGDVDCIRAFLEQYGDIAEFCQIQLNYLDWTLQDAKSKYEYLTQIGMPVWVMESVRGGRLTHFDEATEASMKSVHPDRSIASWGFRWLQGLSNVTMILSGMSSLEQMEDNLATFSERCPLNGQEEELVFSAAQTLLNRVPCTGCRYCCEGCPQGLEIPKLIALYNDNQLHSSVNISMRLSALGDAGKTTNCIGCGQCAAGCPQSLDVPGLMGKMTEAFARLPDWDEVCRQYEAAAKACAEAKK